MEDKRNLHKDEISKKVFNDCRIKLSEYIVIIVQEAREKGRYGPLFTAEREPE